MKNLPMDVLRSFVTVADFGSYTQASELLSRSQPAVSMQLKKLEHLVQRRLFQREEQKLALTEDGEILFDYARKILALNDEAISSIIKPSISGNIRLGIPSEFATTLLPRIVGRFSKTYPTVSLDVSCDLSINLLSAKQRKNFDLILALQDDTSTRGSEKVWVDELVWVSKERFNAQTQEPIPLIVAPDGCIYRKRAIEKLEKLNRQWRIVYTIPDLSGIQSAIEEGLGVTVLAKRTVPDNLQIIKTDRKFPRLGKVSIRLIRCSNKNEEAVTRLMEYLRISMA